MPQPDLRRLAFISRRFHELQGLKTVVLAGACIIAFWSQPYIAVLRHAGPLEAAVGLLLSFFPMAGALLVPGLTRYYRRRVGSVALTPMDRARDVALPLLVLLSGLWRDGAHLGKQEPSALLVAGAALALAISIRDWPWRAHQLIAALGCGVGAWLTATVPAMRADTALELTRIPVTWLLVSYSVTAVLDHRFLVKTVPERHAEPASSVESLSLADRVDE